jgi:hypothetical protein
MLNAIGLFLWNFIVWLAPLVATIVLGSVAWKLWMHYINQDFISGIEWVILEIVPPREVLRSPRGMELFLTNALYHWSMKGGREQYWQGAVWFWHSLEIVSIDGQVHFYIRIPSRLKELVETQMYAQYPQAQIKLVEDYTLGVDKITKDSDWNLYGCEFKLEKAEAYPIKTYVDFGLDKDPKEEFKVDPISPVIELFASIQKGEQMWVQIVVRPAKKEYRAHGVPWYKSHAKKYHDWVAETQVVLNKILDPYTRFHEPRPDGVAPKEMRPPPFLDNTIKAITGKRTKLAFDTGIRVCYVAKKEAFSMNSRRNIRLIFRQYATPSLNALTRINGTQPDAYGGYFLASPETVMLLSNRMLNEYRERNFFYPPLRHKIFNRHVVFWPFSVWLKPYFHSETFVLNVEELATLWHFPGQMLKVPSLERIESKEAAPPSNLPI